MIRVFAIDPGTKHTGVALVDEYGVSCAQTLRFADTLGTDNAAIFDRASEIAERLQPLLDAWRHDVVVIEGYEPFVRNGRVNAAAATQVPILVGYLARFLKDENLHPQTSREVLNPVGRESIYWHYGVNTRGHGPEECRKMLMAKVPGGTKCRTDHERAAAAHALWYIAEHQRLFNE